MPAEGFDVSLTGFEVPEIDGRMAPQDLDLQDRGALLNAIAKARSWMDEFIEKRVQSIAEREGTGVRHIRFLAPLAFLSPRIVDSRSYDSVCAELALLEIPGWAGKPEARVDG